MTSFDKGQQTIALADGDLESVNGGCKGVPVETHNGTIYVSPTTGYPNPYGGHLPVFPIPRGWGPFPV